MHASAGLMSIDALHAALPRVEGTGSSGAACSRSLPRVSIPSPLPSSFESEEFVFSVDVAALEETVRRPLTVPLSLLCSAVLLLQRSSSSNTSSSNTSSSSASSSNTSSSNTSGSNTSSSSRSRLHWRVESRAVLSAVCLQERRGQIKSLCAAVSCVSAVSAVSVLQGELLAVPLQLAVPSVVYAEVGSNFVVDFVRYVFYILFKSLLIAVVNK